MKKTLKYIALILLGVMSLTSCEKDPIEGTAAQAMAGEWFVTAVAVDKAGKVIYEDADLFGIGNFHLDTYNTASNSTTEMWIEDNGNFWDFKNRINIDLNGKTFSAANAQNEKYDCKVTIENGKILEKAATTPHGTPADSIVFIVTFDDDDYPTKYGFYGYRVAGYRYSGLAEDEH